MLTEDEHGKLLNRIAKALWDSLRDREIQNPSFPPSPVPPPFWEDADPRLRERFTEDAQRVLDEIENAIDDGNLPTISKKVDEALKMVKEERAEVRAWKAQYQELVEKYKLPSNPPAPEDLFEAIRSVQRQRRAQYHDTIRDESTHITGHANLGLIWSGMLRLHTGMDVPILEASFVAAMMAAMKIHRISIPGWRADDYIDAASYVEIAYECRKAEETENE